MTNLPVSGHFRITCEYGKKGNRWACGHHTGVDIVSDNRRVYGTCNGKVFQEGYDKAYGNFVVVKANDDTFHWFCHLAKINVIQGQSVNRLTSIGVMGATGNVTGLHLHFEIRQKCNCYGKNINPCEYFGMPNKVGSYNSKDYSLNNFHEGDQVYVRVKFTGAETEGACLIEINEHQMWVYKSTLNNERNEMLVTICHDNGKRYLVECDATEDANRQFWISKEMV